MLHPGRQAVEFCCVEEVAAINGGQLEAFVESCEWEVGFSYLQIPPSGGGK